MHGSDYYMGHAVNKLVSLLPCLKLLRIHNTVFSSLPPLDLGRPYPRSVSEVRFFSLADSRANHTMSIWVEPYRNVDLFSLR